MENMLCILTMCCGLAAAGGQENLVQQSDEAFQAGSRLQAVDLMQKAIQQQPELAGVETQYLPFISD